MGWDSVMALLCLEELTQTVLVINLPSYQAMLSSRSSGLDCAEA